MSYLLCPTLLLCISVFPYLAIDNLYGIFIISYVMMLLKCLAIDNLCGIFYYIMSNEVAELFSDCYYVVQVRVGNTISRHYKLQEGAPLGSVLSVLCFALAFNDVVMEVPEGISCSLYVNDFAIYVSGSRLAGVE